MVTGLSYERVEYGAVVTMVTIGVTTQAAELTRMNELCA